MLVTSPGHGFRFSDGTAAGPQEKGICETLTCLRESRQVATIAGMVVNETRMVLPPESLHALGNLCQMADIVLVPFPVLSALREQGMRDRYPNALAMNATPETQRSARIETKTSNAT